ncbi:Na/Pi cotransporter family protein [Negadavirga shengliensis]
MAVLLQMMEESFDFWKFLAGIGIFLWGMNQLEFALRELAGKSFKDLLQRFTDTGWKGILVGTLITAILQSSSLVTLMVLAFLGGGMISLRNSLGVVLGANLGTTFTAWIVATLGFKISVADFAFPFLALGTLTYLFMSSRPFLKNSGIFLVGFGLLFLGLDFMKTAIENIAEQIDLRDYTGYGLWVFLLVGIVVTALIQSSSAMIVIVLSALNADVIEMNHALALTIGANIGTTFTLVIGAIGGTADKKRLSLANLIFKSVAGVSTFFLIDEMISLAAGVFQIADPLMELVLLNTLINVFGILIFYPFLGNMEKWLRKQFGSSEPKGVSVFIKHVSTEMPSVAILSFEKEIALVLDRTMKFIKKLMTKSFGPKKDASVWKRIIYQPKDLMSEYAMLKYLEDELTEYGIHVQEENLRAEEAESLMLMMRALRSMVYGAKEFKDIIHNIKEMEASEDPLVSELLQNLKETVIACLSQLKTYHEGDRYEDNLLVEEKPSVRFGYFEIIHSLYQKLKFHKPDVPISTLTNVIRQVFSGLDHMGDAVIYLHRIHEGKKPRPA